LFSHGGQFVTRAFGKAQGRIEDARFLTGQGRYVDDIAPPDALFAVFLRSPVAHARLIGIDLAEAERIPGLRLILTAERLEAAGVALGMKGTTVRNHDGSRGAAPFRPVLAKDRLRFVGEPVAMIVADTLDAAKDAAEAVTLNYEDLPVKVAACPGGPDLHPEAPGNIAYDWAMGEKPAVQAALAASAHRVRLAVTHNRIIVNAMEPRGAYAEWDGGKLHLCVNGQGVWVQKGELCRMFGLEPSAVRVTNPDVGGGFGMKAMTYPEYIALAQAARALGRPVRWMSDRTEAMLSDNGGRGLLAETEIGFDKNFKITAYHVDVTSDLGAYNSQFGQVIQSDLFAKVLTGAYDIPCASFGSRAVYTNTTPIDAYRGAGRPEAILTLERALDHAARVLGIDPFDLRLRNFIRTFPHRMMNGEVIDVGAFDVVLNRLRQEADVAGFAERRASSAARGLLRGGGLATYIEAILGNPEETAEIRFDADGGLTLFVGTQSNGQGHETVYTQLLADRTGVDPALIRIVQGDSDQIAKGGGTGGSRSVTTQGTAMLATVAAMTSAFVAFLSAEMGEGVTFEAGRFGSPASNLRLTLMEAAERARAAGRADLLRHSQTTRLQARSFPNGSHWAEVEVDPETGQIWLDRYVVTDDFGVILNPQLVAGQVHGGIAQGFGQAVMENTVHDAQGQLLTASFMDYAMPRAQDLPLIRFTTESIPSTANVLGMKGCGEAGTVGSLGAVCNAVADALAPLGVLQVDMPFTPQRVWGWIETTRTQRKAS
jgi:aerobic carbon-monoxide dehydrogenase large subunit